MKPEFDIVCIPHQYTPSIKEASRIVDIDLEQPIDISQMTVHESSVLPVEVDNMMKFHRKTELRTYDNEGDLITVTITRLSNRRPKNKEKEIQP